MAKQKPTHKILSYGIYSDWERDSKVMPKIRKFTTEIPVAHGVEFGYVMNIKGARGQKLEFIIEHPDFLDSKGNPAPCPFTGEMFVRSNDWDFFLGDTFWDPLHDKEGEWRLITKLDGKQIANKKFTMVAHTGQLIEMGLEDILTSTAF
jgi:hypothetical protein